jgi:uncharacterized membrane protein YfcA
MGKNGNVFASRRNYILNLERRYSFADHVHFFIRRRLYPFFYRDRERNIQMMEYLLLVSLFVVALLYSSVGHGGGTGYLALLALFGIAPIFMKSTALTLNVFVSAIAFFSYYRAGYFKWKLIFPFLISSIPFAYLGALTQVNPSVYKIILGVFLLIAIARMLFVPKAISETSEKTLFLPALAIGALLGFFSGMIGIGGGIILSPILILMHWANVKESAAASALFIFLNSISGMFALVQGGFAFEPRITAWIAVGVVGGIAGSYFGSYRLKSDKLKYLLAGVLLLASIKLFIF